MWVKGLFIFNHYFTLLITFPLLFGLGIYLTFRLKGIQFTKLRLGFQHLLKKDVGSEGNISNFEAVAAVLAGNLGTGNISGMAIALTTGGPGALVWMWIMATLGTVIKYAECFLGLKYRVKSKQGEYLGGPMYYLSRRLGLKKIAICFSLAAIFTALTVGNLVQVNSMFLPFKKTGLALHILVVCLVLFAGILLIGGLKRISRVLGTLVPVMTSFYLLTAFIILALNVSLLPGAVTSMFKAAFSPLAIAGGTLGYGVLQAITSGFDRGIFATDAGCGIAPVLQSSARCKNPIYEGMVGMIAPFIVMVICTATALVLMVTGAWTESGEFSTNMCTWAFQKGLGHKIGNYVVLVSLILFAFTTIITWAYCGEKAVEYLFSSKYIPAFKTVFLLFLPIGAYFKIALVWVLADISIGFMLITNLIGLIGLSKEVIHETQLEFEPKSSENIVH